MGVSFALLEKEFLVLSVEVDRKIEIEMSTGFTGNVSCVTKTSMQVTLEEIDSIIDGLVKVRKELERVKICPECDLINAPAAPECSLCDYKFDEVYQPYYPAANDLVKYIGKLFPELESESYRVIQVMGNGDDIEVVGKKSGIFLKKSRCDFCKIEVE